MENEKNNLSVEYKEVKAPSVSYKPEKDFYKGMRGELRYKAEGLFKKAKEKGISIEEIDILTLRENGVDFPTLGRVELPTFVVKVKGRDIGTKQVIVDAKQIDYYNRYQKYCVEKVQYKNTLKDERGKILRENGKPKIKDNLDIDLTDWEKFQIAKDLIEDKEFGIEKTITGACDRVIRKLMGENDWLYPDEARLLDEEFSNVQNRIAKDEEERKENPGIFKKATDRQINYLRAKVKNFGVDPEDEKVMSEVLRQAGFTSLDELSTSDMSRIIDNIGDIMPKAKEALAKNGLIPFFGGDKNIGEGKGIKQ